MPRGAASGGKAARRGWPALPRQERDLLVGLGRAFGGAAIFALPMQMTEEMWALGFTIDPWRLLLLLVLTVVLLVVLARHAGFERTSRWADAARDGVIGHAVGIVTSVVVLLLFAIVDAGMPFDEAVGKIAIQSVPAGIGAVLGRSLLANERSEAPAGSEPVSYASQLFLMAVGALFLSLNIAATDEVTKVAAVVSWWHALAIVGASILVMHAFVYALEFRGGTPLGPDVPWWSAFVRFTLVGYVIALATSIYVLWTFHQTDGSDLPHLVTVATVLGFPASLGAAAARLIL